MKLRNRVVVITGASSGFGRGVAEKFAKEGADLVVAARRIGELEKLARDCRKRGVRALAVGTDVSEPEQVQTLVERATGEFGRIDVWVNNAGVSTYGGFCDSPMEEHEQVIRTNLLGCMYGSRAALDQFRRQGHGTLINVASFAGIASFPYGSSYAASKHGIRGFDMALRQELQVNGEHNIHVCTVSPTSMDTPFFQHAANHTGHEVQPIPPVYDPKLVVEAIFNVALKPRDEVVVGRRGKIGKVAKRIVPKLMGKQMAQRTHKAMIEDSQRSADSSGNLFEPVPYGTAVRGGWKRGGLGRNLVSAISVGVPAAAAWLIWTLAKNRKIREQQSAA